MEKHFNTLRALFLFGLTLIAFQSCSEDAIPSGEQEALTTAELQTILTTDEIAGTADNAIAELFANNGVAGKASTDECYTAEYSDTGFVATFNNCVLNGTDNVNGTVTVTYQVGNETAAYTATYEDFYVGNIKINGTRNYALNSDLEQGNIAFTVTSEMTVEMEDGEVISESGTKTFGFTFGEDLSTSTFSLSGNWQVEVDGNTYIVSTPNELSGTLGCEYLSSGTMNISKNGLAIVVDFGDGECDDAATLTYPDGTVEEITL